MKMAPWCLVGGLSFSLLGACESQLPGPEECEAAAYRLLGRNAEQVKKSPAAEHWVGELVRGCLTTPFDRQAVRCLSESRQLTQCLDDLVRRSPEAHTQASLLLAHLSRR
jgi:hypothetical protein